MFRSLRKDGNTLKSATPAEPEPIATPVRSAAGIPELSTAAANNEPSTKDPVQPTQPDLVQKPDPATKPDPVEPPKPDPVQLTKPDAVVPPKPDVDQPSTPVVENVQNENVEPQKTEDDGQKPKTSAMQEENRKACQWIHFDFSLFVSFGISK